MASSRECDHIWGFTQGYLTCIKCGAEKPYTDDMYGTETYKMPLHRKVTGTVKSAVAGAFGAIWTGIKFLFELASYALKDVRVLAVVIAVIIASYFIATHDYVKDRDPTGNERYSVETISCTHYDYCYGPDGVDKDGFTKYGYRYGTCSGSQEAELKYTEWLYTRKSGKQQISERSSVIEKLTKCE